MRELSLDQLRTFAEVVTRGGFSAAALRLGLTQPAVSLQVRALERRLGVRLIERIGKRALPTPAGRELMVHARRALELRPLRGDKSAAILPPGEAAPRVLRPADFAAGPLILYEERAGTRTAIDAWLAAGGVAARPAMELGNVEAIKQLVIAGL